ncbi:hypothetical protein OIU84_004596 [Salix udensis]|uniref:GRAS family transcription factor n=1 Tax=Salix udensis TaxID=889485 RepID=A0AAD6K2U6_9ROSI|nr:hypothetical protein OIU84_004596 [Salix udensis]
MTIEESEPNHASDHVMDWLEESVSFLPTFLDDPYSAADTNPYQCVISPINPTMSNHPPTSTSSKKRKDPEDPVPKTSQNHNQRKNLNRRISKEEQDGETAVEEVVAVKKSNGNKKSTNKSTGNNSNNGNKKEGKWAEQLLNPCAAAITSGNLSRVQHLLYVLHELASPTGDANHRLAAHGLRALTHHVSSSSTSSSASIGTFTFASTEPKFFQKALLKFYEWPTLLEALTRRPGGPPPLVRITVITATTENDQSTAPPFSVGPPGDNFSSRLLGFAKLMNINLEIKRLDGYPLQKLNGRIIDAKQEETLIVSKTIWIVAATVAGILQQDSHGEWSIYGDSWTQQAQLSKGRESEERRMMEGEGSKALTNRGEMNEGKDKWCERMKGAGFVGEMFGEDAIDGGRALLRKYDSNWEMRTEGKDGCVGLWWKGQPVSFCSLWKLDMKGNDS